MLGFDGEYTAVPPKAKFGRFLVKNRKKSAVKHSIQKPILLNFLNLSRTFCPKLKEVRFFFSEYPEHIFLFNLYSLFMMRFKINIKFSSITICLVSS